MEVSAGRLAPARFVSARRDLNWVLGPSVISECQTMSALPPKAGTAVVTRDVRFVPIAGIPGPNRYLPPL